MLLDVHHISDTSQSAAGSPNTGVTVLLGAMFSLWVFVLRCFRVDTAGVI